MPQVTATSLPPCVTTHASQETHRHACRQTYLINLTTAMHPVLITHFRHAQQSCLLWEGLLCLHSLREHSTTPLFYCMCLVSLFCVIAQNRCLWKARQLNDPYMVQHKELQTPVILTSCKLPPFPTDLFTPESVHELSWTPENRFSTQIPMFSPPKPGCIIQGKRPTSFLIS